MRIDDRSILHTEEAGQKRRKGRGGGTWEGMKEECVRETTECKRSVASDLEGCSLLCDAVPDRARSKVERVTKGRER